MSCRRSRARPAIIRQGEARLTATRFLISVLFVVGCSSSVIAQSLVTPRSSKPVDVWSEVNPAWVCSATTFWRIGTQTRSPRDMTETVSNLSVDGRLVWRISHLLPEPPDPAASNANRERDSYDLDARTLYPIESEYRSAGSRAQPVNRFVYEIDSDRVRRLGGRGEEAEGIDLAGRVPLPEGPGSAAIFQAIGWRDGLRLNAYVIDRWRGAGDERMHRVEISVIGRGAVTVQGRSMVTFMVSVEPDNDAYRILHHVTVDRPHLIIRTEYSAGTRAAFISEVAALTRDPACSTGA